MGQMMPVKKIKIRQKKVFVEFDCQLSRLYHMDAVTVLGKSKMMHSLRNTESSQIP